MNQCVIYNPRAGSAELMDQLHSALGDVKLREAQSPGDTSRLAASADGEGFELVVAAGGDGTINAVVNGLMAHRRRPVLAVLPLGTGNDFARSLEMPIDDPAAALAAIRSGMVRTIDLIKVRFGRGPVRWCVNAAAGGFTGQMNEAITDEIKQAWGTLAYLRGAMKVVPDLANYHTTVRYDGSAAEQVGALNVIVANGRTAGAGMPVAPPASLEDGLLDVVIVQIGTMMELTGIAARLLSGGNYIDSKAVTHRRAKRVAIESTPGMWFNIDGELISNEPATFTIVPGALRVVVGPRYGSSSSLNSEFQIPNAE